MFIWQIKSILFQCLSPTPVSGTNLSPFSSENKKLKEMKLKFFGFWGQINYSTRSRQSEFCWNLSLGFSWNKTFLCKFFDDEKSINCQTMYLCCPLTIYCFVNFSQEWQILVFWVQFLAVNSNRISRKRIFKQQQRNSRFDNLHGTNVKWITFLIQWRFDVEYSTLWTTTFSLL